MEIKTCKTCNIEKPLTDFPKGAGYKGGYRPHCLPCRQGYERASFHLHKHKRPYNYAEDKSRKLQKEYGIDYQQYLKMLEEQGGKCVICGTTSTGKRKAFHVDHCHETGKIRGLLCGNCNSGIGNLRDDVSLLEQAIKYLKASNGKYI